VELENAANSCALAEIWFGRQTFAVRNLVAVTVSEGIGVGLILIINSFKDRMGWRASSDIRRLF